MQRRTFIRDSALTAFAVSAFGFVRFDGKQYVGDCETTSDILGPFYRPGSPVRSDFHIAGETGTPVTLSGRIRHNDCVTPYAKARVELWHCDAKGVYDNNSADFRYRGTAYTDQQGRYAFNTIMPVTYDVGNGQTRPAHFHMMITAEGYQPLVTQLYFTGDKFIPTDPSAASPAAKRRILSVKQLGNGKLGVDYDVSMSPELLVEPEALGRLAGKYSNPSKTEDTVELFKKDGTLWMKNEVFGDRLKYAGNNTFIFPGTPVGYEASVLFDLKDGGITMIMSYTDDFKQKHETRYSKVLPGNQ